MTSQLGKRRKEIAPLMIELDGRPLFPKVSRFLTMNRDRSGKGWFPPRARVVSRKKRFYIPE